MRSHVRFLAAEEHLVMYTELQWSTLNCVSEYLFWSGSAVVFVSEILAEVQGA